MIKNDVRKRALMWDKETRFYKPSIENYKETNDLKLTT